MADGRTPIEDTLFSRFVAGRAMGMRGEASRIPTSATDVVEGDRLGDYRNDGTYEYKCVNVGTYPTVTLRWDRRTLSIGW